MLSRDPEAGRPRPGIARYLAALLITVLAVVSQYFLPEEVPALAPLYRSLAGDLAVVYGIPVVACLCLLGLGPLRRWRERMGLATVEGLRWYGLLSLLALLVVIVLTIAYGALDPRALDFLKRPNPALQQAAHDPWLFVGLSFVAGAAEETIFRGWMFGFWRGRSVGWMGPAVGTSALFAGVHLYYGFAYGPAAPLVYPALFFIGLAFAQAYRLSGGNLLVIALLHGVNDATSYLTLVVGNVAIALHYGVILVGALLALVVFLRSRPAEGVGGSIPATPEPAWPYVVGDRISSTQMPSGPS